MKPLVLKGSEIDFAITLDKSLPLFKISGKSRPENVVDYFEPVFDWLNKYIQQPLNETIFKFDVEYFNSSTAKVLLRLLVKLEELLNNGFTVKVEWHYRANDEDMMEAGEDLESLVDIPFGYYEYN